MSLLVLAIVVNCQLWVTILLSTQKKSGYFGFPAVQTRATHHRLDQSRIVSHSKLSPLPPFVPPCPREAPPRTPAGYEPCDRHTLQRWKKDSFKFPLYQYLWQNGLTNSETWWYLDADERERLLGFRPDHSRPATSTSTKKKGAGQRAECVHEDVRRTRGCSRICSQSYSAASKFQRLSILFSSLSISSLKALDIISDDRNMQVAKSGGWVLSSTLRFAAQHTPSSVVEMEKRLWLCMEASNTSTCWNFEQLSMGSYGVGVPHRGASRH